MAKRLSKALRGKRRWLGVAFDPKIEQRNDAKKAIEDAFGEVRGGFEIRLMDFHASESDQAKTSHTFLAADEETRCLSYGILQVPHEIYTAVKDLCQSTESLSEIKIKSITSSGKIRLVRERLCLERPHRRR